MADQERDVFDLGGFMQSKGAEIVDIDRNTGEVTAVGPDGEEAPLDVKALLDAVGIDPKTTDIQFNNPDTSINRSPIDDQDTRTLLRIGNTQGNIKFLRNKFEDVKFSAEKGITVKDQGVWFTVDPGFFSARDTTKELIKDISEEAPSLIAKGAAVAGGAAVGAKAGAVLGGALAPFTFGVSLPVLTALGGLTGAGVAGFGARVAEAKIAEELGTFEETPESTLMHDAAMEGILSAGGMTIVPGLRATLKGMGASFKNLARKAVPGDKKTIEEIGSRMTNTKPQTWRTVLGSADEVGDADQVIKILGKQKGKGLTKAIDGINDRVDNMMGGSQGVFTKAVDNLSKRFERGVNKVNELIGDDRVNVKDIRDSFLSDMDGLGLIRAARSTKIASKLLGPTGRPIQQTTSKFTGEFKLQDPSIMREALFDAGVSPREIPKIIKQVGEVSQIFQRNRKGSMGGKDLTDLYREVNKLMGNLRVFTPSNDPNQFMPVGRDIAKNLTLNFRRNIREKINSFGKPVEKAFNDVNELWSKNIEAATQARALTEKELATGLQTFRRSVGNQLNTAQRDFFSKVANISGEGRGRTLLRTIDQHAAAADLARRLPATGILSAAGIGGAASVALGAPGVGLPVAGLVAAAASPRAALRTAAGIGFQRPRTEASVMMPFITSTKEFIKSIPPKSLSEFLEKGMLGQALINTRQAAIAQLEQERLLQQQIQQAGQ